MHYAGSLDYDQSESFVCMTNVKCSGRQSSSFVHIMMFDCLARNVPTPLKNVMLMPKLRAYWTKNWKW